MEKLIVIRTASELENLKTVLESSEIEYVAFDTETTGVSKESEIIGYSIAYNDHEAYYVVLSEWNPTWKKLDYLDTRALSEEILLGLRFKQLIMHNAIFDCWMVRNNFGIELMPSVHTDTMQLAWLLDENRRVGLKELGTSIWGLESAAEQAAMKESVTKNGGSLTKDCYELYKADSEIMGRYGAKDAILTFKLFLHLTEELFEQGQGLQNFFYDEETMPLLRGPTYDLNTTGLKVDPEALQTLKRTLEAETMEQKAFIYKEIQPLVADKYPGTSKAKTFNISAPRQLAWLLFEVMGQEFGTLTDEGRELCHFLGVKLPYSYRNKRDFVQLVKDRAGMIWVPEYISPKTSKLVRAKKIGNYWNYVTCGKETLGKLADKYKWVEVFLAYAKNCKILKTYVGGIETHLQYGIIRPSFLQHGTTSGRYSCKAPNFQNLPRDDKRVKSCIVARPGKVFVAADYAQLEPRVFASFSKDERLMACFEKGEDFYSVIGMEVFGKYDCSVIKDDKNSFAKLYPSLRNASKVIALSAAYGTTAPKMAPALGMSMDQAQEVIDNYFESYPSVKQLMVDSHDMAKKTGQVTNLFGRPRRMPAAMDIPLKRQHKDLPYDQRNILNLAMNHRIQSTGASIMNRAAIAFCNYRTELAKTDPRWNEVKIIIQVHDELGLEGPEELAEEMVALLKEAMEHTVELPGVKLLAEPKIAKNLADLK